MTFNQKCFITQLPVLNMKEAFLVQINFSSCHFFNKFKDVWMASKGPARLRSKVLILYYAIMNLSRWFHFDSTQGFRKNGVYKVETRIIRKICNFKIKTYLRNRRFWCEWYKNQGQKTSFDLYIERRPKPEAQKFV